MYQATAPEHSPSAGRHEREADTTLAQLIAELVDSLSHYAEVRRDRLRLQIRFYLVVAAASFVGLTVFVGLAVAAAVLILVGIAGGLAESFGGRWWLGSLVTGTGFFVAVGTTLWLGAKTFRRREVRLLRQKYETRQNQRPSCTE